MSCDAPHLVTEQQAAAYLTISLSTLRRWRRSGAGPRFLRVGGIIRYRVDDLDAFITANLTKGGAVMRRSDGLYQRRQYWYWKYKSPDGVWVERASRTRNYGEAKKLRAAFLRDLEEGKLPNERSRWTLQEAVAQWLAERKPRIGAASYASESTITRTLLRLLGGNTASKSWLTFTSYTDMRPLAWLLVSRANP